MTNPLNNLQTYVDQMIDQHRIPALSVALWHNGQLHQAAAGCLNLNTGVNATTDSIFHIGSITKVMTTCLVMQLVDEGKVELDAPVVTYLRDFLLADAEATITVRQLLNHSNGIAGDYFNDEGHQGNLIARYVDRCAQLPIIHPIGKMYSYSNSAFAVAGRLVEVVRGISWYQAMEEYLYRPLGMDQAIADPKDVLRYRVAMGHVFDGDNTERWVQPEKAYLTLGLAPVGSTPAMTAADLITFARAHLNNGLSESGERWLSPESVVAMQREEIRMPDFSQVLDFSAGLGWERLKVKADGPQIIGHTGAVRGLLASLRMVPERNSAFAILMNGFRPSALKGISRDLLNAIADVDVQEPPLPEPAPQCSKASALAGRYESFDTVIDICENGGKLQAGIVYKIDPLPPAD